MPKTLSLLAVLKKVDAKGVKSLSNAQWNTFLASDTEPNEIQAKIAKLEGYEEKGVAYDATGELILEDNNAMIERFRQRTGRAQGRESLKVKKSKINVKSFKEDFLNKKEEEPVVDKSQNPPINFDSDSPSNPDLSKPEAEEEKKEETEGLKGIRDVLDDILKVLRLDFKGDRKEARDAQKEAARKKRGKREDKLEGVGKAAAGIGKAISAMVKPFSSIWDTVMNFVKTVIIGVLLNKIMKWFGNPKNQDKIKSLGKFFKDWWPTLTTAALLFLTPLGGLVKGVVGLLTAIIPKLVMAIAANPWAAAAVLGGVAIWGVAKMAGGGGKKKEKQEEMDIPEAEIDDQVEMSGGGMVPHVVDAPTSAQNFIQKYNQGGLVQHLNEGGMVGKELVYSPTKFTTEKVGKGDEIERTKTRERTTSVIQLEDLYENQDQILSQLPEGTTIESIVNGTSGIDPQVLYPILQSSDAQMASIAGMEGLPGLGGGGGGTDAITAKAKTKSVGARTKDVGNLLARPFRKKEEKDPRSEFATGFNKGGEVPGSGNKDTVPAMLTPGEFVMSKGAVDKYGSDTLESMNAAASSGTKGDKGDKGDTVPAMLTPGEFVVSAPAVQKFGVDTMESMNLKGGGNNKPELKEPNVEVNNGGLISNYRNMKTNHYYTGGLVQYLQGGGEVDKPQGMMRWLAGAADHMTMGLTDFDKRGSILDGAKRVAEKIAPGTPVQQGENKTITLPTIPKQNQSMTRTNSDVPQFRIAIESPQRSMVISSLGIQDLVGG